MHRKPLKKSDGGMITNQTLKFNPNTNDCKQLIKIGHQKQHQSKESLNWAIRDMEEMGGLGDQVQSQLHRQIEQLDRIYQTTKNTQTTMKRAQKYVRDFASQVATDKCLMAMIILIVLAIIAIVVISIIGVNKGSFDQPDQIKTS